jgi:CRP-like cAMP-binding protein
LLSLLPDAELADLACHFEPVTLARRHQLEAPNKRIDHVYFLEHGIASFVATNHADAQVEVSLVGCEGMTGIPVILGTARWPQATFVQVAGSGQRIAATDFRATMERNPVLRDLLLRYIQTVLSQTAYTAVANARATIEERLARWLLMAHDRIDGDDIELTHEFISLLMGIRRPGVTEALQGFAQQGLIRTERGLIIVLDRDGLLRTAGRYYGIPEAEFDRLIG